MQITVNGGLWTDYKQSEDKYPTMFEGMELKDNFQQC